MKKVVVLDTGYDSYAYEEKLFTDAGYKFELFPGARHDRQGKIQFAKDAVGIFVRWTKVNDEFLDAIPHLKSIVRYGVGYDNIDLNSASSHNVKVSIVQGYANHAVSDHAIALMYMCVRRIKQAHVYIKNNFGTPPDSQISELHNKTVGIIGLGRIGSTFCTKVKNLFADVLAVDPYIPDVTFIRFGAHKTDLETLLESSDVISVHCNLTDETENLIDMNKIKLMAKQPILINTARGPIVNEDDLLLGLNSGLINSAGLDVFVDEPPLENRDELLKHPNVVATGHYAWYSREAVAELQKRAADNLLMMLNNKIPDDCLNP